MGLLKSLFKLLLGLTTGFALGYTAVSWLIGQERRPGPLSPGHGRGPARRRGRPRRDGSGDQGTRAGGAGALAAASTGRRGPALAAVRP